MTLMEQCTAQFTHPYLLPNSWLHFLSGPVAFSSTIAYADPYVISERRGYNHRTNHRSESKIVKRGGNCVIYLKEELREVENNYKVFTQC